MSDSFATRAWGITPMPASLNEAQRQTAATGGNARYEGPGWAASWATGSAVGDRPTADNSAAGEESAWSTIGQRALRTWLDENPF